MTWKWLSEKRAFCAAILLALLLLLVPFSVRMLRYNGIMMGSESYYHASIASEIASNGIPKADSLSFDQRTYRPNPYHLLLAFASRFMSIELASMIAPIAFGFASLILFYLLLKRFGFDLKVRFLSLLILIASPAFIASFTSSSPDCFAIMLSLLALYLFLEKKPMFTFFASVLFVIIGLFSFFNALVIALFVFFYGIYERKLLRLCSVLCFLMLVVSFVYYYPNLVTQNIASNNILADFISDLGAGVGFGFFNIILAGIGFVTKWMKKKRLFLFYALALFFALSVLFLGAHGNAYLNFVVSVFAGFGFLWFFDTKWELPSLKNLALFVVVCGLVFSSLSYLSRTSVSMPDQNFKESLEWLGTYASPEDVVISHYSYGFWIEYFAKNKVLMDDFKTPNHEKIFADYDQIFYSRNLEETQGLLSDYGIKYIVLTDDMRSGLVWSREQEGLLFLLRNSETFKNVYNKQGIEIWECLG